MQEFKRCRGVGPTPCDWMLVAECPGYYEGLKGVPLVGKTGDEVNRYLDGANLPSRHEIFLTNLYREFVFQGYEYTLADLRRDEPDLHEEFARVRPSLVITLGRHSTRYFLGDVDMDDVHAIPWTSEFQARPIVVFPIFHPAAGFHDPSVQAYISYGFAQLAAYRRGGIAPRILFDDPFEGKEQYVELQAGQARISEPVEIAVDTDCGDARRALCNGRGFAGTTAEACDEEMSLASTLQGVTSPERNVCNLPSPMAIDTEGTVRHPWSLQWSAHPGTGTLVRTSSGRLRECLHHLLRGRSRVLFHHALHDLGVIERLAELQSSLGFDIDWISGRFDDTMTMAYLLQMEPQGLKSLALRHAGRSEERRVGKECRL